MSISIDYPRLARFCAFSRLLADNLGAPDLPRRALEQLLDLAEANQGVIYLNQGKGLAPFASVGCEEESLLPLAFGEGVAGRAAQKGEAVHCPNPDPVNDTLGLGEMVDAVAFPLRTRNELLGALFLGGGPFATEEIALLNSLADQLAIALDDQRAHENADKALVFDEHTGLLNRSYFTSRLEVEFSRAFRYESDLSLLLVALDNYDKIAASGRQNAEAAMATVAQIVRKSVRDSDLCGRYDDEKFVVALPHTNRDQAAIVAEKIRKTVAECFVPYVEGEQVTVSIGLSCYPDSNALSLEELNQKTGDSLQRARDQGHDQVVIA